MFCFGLLYNFYLKNHLFLCLGQFDKPLNERLGNVGDLSDRKEMREKMQCKSFKWFLDTIVAGEIFFQSQNKIFFEK